MNIFVYLRRTLNDRQNWLAIMFAGALVFLGIECLDLLDLDHAIWKVLVVVIAAFAATLFMKKWV